MAGATVVIESWQIPTPSVGFDRRLLEVYATVTDASGHWNVPAERGPKPKGYTSTGSGYLTSFASRRCLPDRR